MTEKRRRVARRAKTKKADVADVAEAFLRDDAVAVPQPQAVRHEAPCSIELSRDAKGQPRWSIKLYGERDDMDAVLREVLDLDRRLTSETRIS